MRSALYHGEFYYSPLYGALVRSRLTAGSQPRRVGRDVISGRMDFACFQECGIF